MASRLPIYLICLVIVAGDDLVTIDTVLGPVKGLQTKYEETGGDLYEFRGIPYGKPPIGKLRFRKPEPFGKWEGTLDATKFKAACAQYGMDFIPEFKRPEMSEDCLVLNIYVPGNTKQDAIKKSVMVWIHGGGFSIGHGHQYDGGRIATVGDVIVVTINYRLGMFGLLATDHPSSRGNYGLWDQKLALQWVYDNIAAFGGNPDSVTIFGESAGGCSVSLQSVNPTNKGLFKRAIAQSGVITRNLMQKRSAIPRHIKTLSHQTKCPSENLYKFVDCLREKSVDEILNSTNPFSSMPSDKFQFEYSLLPIVDGDFFQDHPVLRLEDINSEESKFFGSLDFITGVTSEEGSILHLMLLPDLQKHFSFNVTEGIPSKFVCQALTGAFASVYFNNNDKIKEKLCNYYSSDESLAIQSMKATQFYADVMFNYGTMKMLEHHSVLGGKTYQYVLEKISPMPFGGPPPPWFKGSGHGDELLYLFDINKAMSFVKDVILSDQDKEFSKTMINYWTSFAKYGIPDGGKGTPAWRQFDMKDKSYLNFDVTITERSNFKPDMMDFWSNQLSPIELEGVDAKNHDEL